MHVGFLGHCREGLLGRSPGFQKLGEVAALAQLGDLQPAITRLVGAMMLEQNDEWSLNRRYMQFEGLQTLCDTVPTRLPAVAR